MKILTHRALHLPLTILSAGLVIPLGVTVLGIITLSPGIEGWIGSLPLWFSTWIYLGLALLALRMTWLKLGESVSAGPTCNHGQHAIHAYMRTIELLIMGIAMHSLSWGTAPAYFDEVVFFVSLRLGITLLILGGAVLMFTHIKMRRVQE